MIRTVDLDTLTTAGTAVSDDVIAGELLAAYVLHNTAGTMTLQTQHAPQVTLLSLDAGGTQWYYPRGTICTTAAAAFSYASSYPIDAVIPFVDNVQVVTNAAGTAQVTLIVRT
jgi:hypothetical protein